MKLFLDVEKDRFRSYKLVKRNTVHRSSLIVPRFNQSISNISFLNHFLLKRNNKDVVLKITAINDNGAIEDSVSIEVNKPIVYSLNLEFFFKKVSKIREYLIEFYSDKNLFIPFPAVMVNHIGNEFVNTVHSYNRVLNDIFEDDKVNHHHVFESSIDVSIDKDYDTFFNFATGPFKIKKDLKLSLTEEKKKTYTVPIEMKRLTNKNIFLSNFHKNNIKSEVILKVLQPEQNLFYGRLLTGRINRKTKAFSANHSYYDNSLTKEYFNNSVSVRTYPFFNDCLNKIIMYPIMSPSSLEVLIEIYGNHKTYRSESQTIKSPSNSSILFDINEIVKKSGLNNVSLFKVIAKSSNKKIPTRVSHQLINGEKESTSKLFSSISTQLSNESSYNSPLRPGLIWGQVLVNKSYESRLGICFINNSGSSEIVSVDFYTKSGLFKSIKRNLNPNNSLILDNNFFKKIKAPNEFVWYLAKSKRSDLQAISFHYHKLSGNASGEHSF